MGNDQITISSAELRAVIKEVIDDHDAKSSGGLTKLEVEKIAQTSVREMLTSFGVDHKNPLELQQDFSRLREWRRSMDAVKGKALWGAVAFLFTGLVGLVVMGLKVWAGRVP